MTNRLSGALPRAAVIGAGRMGHGIALEAARGGFNVAIYDTQPGRAEAWPSPKPRPTRMTWSRPDASRPPTFRPSSTG